MQLVTDPDILAQLNSDEEETTPELQPVTDPDLLKLLNSDEEETPPPATDWKTGMVTPQRLPELGTPSNYMKNSVDALTGSRSNTEIPVTEEALKSAESAVEENRPQVPMGGVGPQLPEEENKARLAEELKQLRLKYAKQEEIASRGPLDTLAHGAGGLETYLEGVKEELKATKDPVSVLTREAGKGLEGADYLARKAINELTPELVAPKPEENSILGQMKRDPTNKMMDEAFAKGEKAAIEKGVPQAETLVEKGLSMAPAFLTPGGAAKGLGMLEKGGTALAKEGVSLGKDLGKIAKDIDLKKDLTQPFSDTLNDIKSVSKNIRSKMEGKVPETPSNKVDILIGDDAQPSITAPHIFSGTLQNVEHLSKDNNLGKFRETSSAPLTDRYDAGTGSIFGNETYLSEKSGTTDWEGISLGTPYKYNGDVNFNKAFVLTPETLGAVKEIKTKYYPNEDLISGEELVNALKTEGYDGLIVRNMDVEALQEGTGEFNIKNAIDQGKKWANESGLGAEAFQDQIVSFHPESSINLTGQQLSTNRVGTKPPKPFGPAVNTREELNKLTQDTTPLTTPESQQAWSKTVTDRYKLVDDVINGSIPKEIAQTELNKIPDNVDELSAADKKIISLQNGALNHLDDPDALKVLLGDVDNTITQQQVEKMIKPFLYESKTMRYATNFRTNLINSYNTIMKDQLTKAKSQFIDPVTGKLDKKKLKEFTGEQDILQRLAVPKLEAFDEGINRYIGSKVHGDADGFAQVLAKDPETGDMIYKTSDMRAFDPIINDLRNNNINQADFDRYLLARDAVDQFTKDPKLDGYSGFRTMDEALAEVSKWETNPVAVKAAEDLHKLAKSNLDDMVIGGRLSRNEADQILAAHPNYVGVMLKRPNWLTPEIEEALGIKISAPSTRNTVKERTGKFKEERHSALGSIRNGLVNQSREAANNAVVASTFLESIRKLSPELRGVLYPGYEDSKLQELLSHYRLSRAEEDVIKTEILNTLPASTEEYLNRIQQSSLPDKAKEVLINKVEGVQKIVQRNLEDAAKEADVSKKYAVANFFDKNGNPIKGQTIPDDILKTMTDELQGYISGLEKDFDVDLKEVPDVGLSFYINGNKLDVNTASPYMAEMLRRNKPDYGKLKGVKDVSRFASRNLTSGFNALRIFLKEGADLPMFGAKGVTIYPYENVVTLMKMLRNKDPLISKYKKEFHETYGLSHQGRMSDLQTEYAPIKDIDDQIKSNTYGQRSTAGQAWDFSMKSLDMWDNAFDTATRLTIYKKAREAGYTRSEATIMANKTGVDFSQKGLDAKSVNAIKLFPFLYTSIKTGDRMLSLAMNNPARFSSAVMQGWAVSEVIDMWNNQFFDEDGKPIMSNLPESRRMGHNYVLLPGAKSFNDSIDLYSGFVVGNQKEWVNKALKLTNQYVSDRLPSAIEESIVDMAPAFKEEGIENADQIIAAYKTIAEKNKVTFPDLLKTFVLAQMNTFALPTQAPVVSGVTGAILGIDPITGKPFTDVGGAPAEAEQAYNPLQVPPYFLALREDFGLKHILPGASPKAEWFILSNTFYNGLIKTVAEATAVPLGEMAGLYTMPEGSFAQNLPVVSPLGKLGEYTRDREMASDAMARVNAIVFQHQALQKNHRNDPNDLDKLTALDTFEKEFGPILANAPVFDSLRADLKGIDIDQKNVMKDKDLSPSDKRDVIKSTEKRKAYAAKQINLLYTSGGFMSDEDIDLLDEGKIKFGPIIQPMIEKSKLKSRGVE